MKNKQLVKELKQLIESHNKEEVEKVFSKNISIINKEEIKFLINIADFEEQEEIISLLNTTTSSHESRDSSIEEDEFLNKESIVQDKIVVNKVDVTPYREKLDELIQQVLEDLRANLKQDYYNIAFNIVTTLAYHMSDNDLLNSNSIEQLPKLMKQVNALFDKHNELQEFVKGLADASFVNLDTTDNKYYSTIYSDCITEINQNVSVLGDSENL